MEPSGIRDFSEPVMKIKSYTGRHRDFTFDLEWTIDDFESKMESYKPEEEIKSDEYEYRNIKWHVELYPDGEDEDNEGWVSVFLHSDCHVGINIIIFNRLK